MKKVIIKDYRRIPQIGRGPILKPISIDDDLYNLLKLLGYNVIDVNSENTTALPNFSINKDTVSDDTEEVIEDTVSDDTEEVVEEENIENNEEEDDEVVEEIDIDVLTKKELKEILSENNIEYNEKDNLATLKKKVKELYK